MSRAGRITRRFFVVGSAAIAGGVAFGTYRLLTPPANPLEYMTDAAGATFNPYVMITSERITLIAPHVDLGQGAASMQAMLIAEEMDLDLDQFEVSPGPPAAAYYNTAMADEAVPFRSTDRGLLAETARETIGAAIKLAGFQITGGSTSVPDSFVKLRQAGAMARETLKRTAAARSGLPPEALSTEAGAVILPDGTRIDYRDLAGEASGVTPPDKVALRPPAQWRHINKPVQRIDIVPKSTGTQIYGIDLRFEGMLHAALRLNPNKGASLRGYDDTAARKMRGVVDVLPVRNGLAIIAENTWYAFQALDAIDYDWAEAAYPQEQAEHWATLEASFTPERLEKVWRDDGDAEAYARSDLSVAYRAPYVAHQPLEPLNAVALVTETNAEIWTAHQMPRIVQNRVAEGAGLSPDEVTVHNQAAGGSFGHRLEFEVVDRAVEIARALPGRHIKLTFSREEDFAQDHPRQIAAARANGSVEAGRVLALDLQIAAPSPIRSQMGRMGLPVPGPDMQIVAGAWNMPYDIPNLRVRGYAAPELAPISSWRSVGASTAGFFAESALDELIHAAGADPMTERLRMVNDPVARRVLEAVADMSDWDTPLPAGSGRGVALVVSFGVPVAEVVQVTQTEGRIRIDKVFVAVDAGTVVDPVNFENQVQGGVIWGLGHAINSEITYGQGRAEQSNYHDAEGMRLYHCPQIIVRALETAERIRGIGEPPVPPAAPALANAIFAATGQRLREMPFFKFVDFV